MFAQHKRFKQISMPEIYLISPFLKPSCEQRRFCARLLSSVKRESRQRYSSYYKNTDEAKL
ncbi:hypothetical protein BpHYR1_014014 [Brachionus plicatilis]|uniref:Uncharacterized protein n=1 Tax=Brachionus plicatilis TaxID=10195 RepID=A0A3M7QUD9_BRAPC|nr:hypothetical protein BpHYR1_014014 [Brachionus plicatilis]